MCSFEKVANQRPRARHVNNSVKLIDATKVKRWHPANIPIFGIGSRTTTSFPVNQLQQSLVIVRVFRVLMYITCFSILKIIYQSTI